MCQHPRIWLCLRTHTLSVCDETEYTMPLASVPHSRGMPARWGRRHLRRTVRTLFAQGRKVSMLGFTFCYQSERLRKAGKLLQEARPKQVAEKERPTFTILTLFSDLHFWLHTRTISAFVTIFHWRASYAMIWTSVHNVMTEVKTTLEAGSQNMINNHDYYYRLGSAPCTYTQPHPPSMKPVLSASLSVTRALAHMAVSGEQWLG